MAGQKCKIQNKILFQKKEKRKNKEKGRFKKNSKFIWQIIEKIKEMSYVLTAEWLYGESVRKCGIK